MNISLETRPYNYASGFEDGQAEAELAAELAHLPHEDHSMTPPATNHVCASYGEPWGPGQLIGHIVRTDGTFVGELNNVEDEMRVRACVNACKGIADPVEAIREARDTLGRIVARANSGEDIFPRSVLIRLAQDALTKLTP